MEHFAIQRMKEQLQYAIMFDNNRGVRFDKQAARKFVDYSLNTSVGRAKAEQMLKEHVENIPYSCRST